MGDRSWGELGACACCFFLVLQLHVSSGQSKGPTACPLTYNAAEVDRAAWNCQKSPASADCCSKAFLALQGARARYAGKTGELYLTDVQAQACLTLLQAQLTARGLPSNSSSAVVGDACQLNTAELVVRVNRAGACGNLTNTAQFTSSLGIDIQDILRTSCADPLSNCTQCLTVIGQTTLAQIPDPGLLYKEECVKSAKLAIQANTTSDREPLLSQCFWDSGSIRPDCNWVNWDRANFTAAVNGCRLPQDCSKNGQCACCNVLIGLSGLETSRVAAINGSSIMPPDQATACSNDFARHLDLWGLNSSFLIKDCATGPADFGQQNTCANLISVSDFANASDNYAVNKAYCSPGNCSASCQDQVIGEAQALAVAQSQLLGTAPTTRLVENCVRWFMASYASIYQPNYEPLTSAIACFITLTDDTYLRLNTTTLQIEANATIRRPPLPAPESSSSNLGVAIGASLGGVGGFLLLLLVLWLVYRKMSRGREKHPLFKSFNSSADGPVCYSYSQLRSATGGFSAKNMIGKGGSGRVYKGTLPNGQVVAVKELIRGASERGEKEFINEALIINSVRHKNLVLLRGCCAKDQHRLLVYDYMPNGNLDQFLFNDERKPFAKPQEEGLAKELINSWDLRFKLAVGTARGLAYLHEEVKPRIIHRDVKPSNILLDENMEALVADFGLAKLTAEEVTHVSTGVVGTWGYLAPEYAASGHLTEKSDVYSFGVVLLELIAGRRPVAAEAAEVYLVEWAWSLAEDGDLLHLVDPRIRPLEDTESVLRAVKVALLAVHTAVVNRPSMSQCVRMLLGVEAIPPLPDRPITLFTVAAGSGSDTTQSGSSSMSRPFFNSRAEGAALSQPYDSGA